MRRLSFPYALPYFEHDYVVTFVASPQRLAPLGEPCYVERDPAATAGVPEWYWAFESESGLRFDVEWDEHSQAAMVRADPPDPAQAIAALRSLGLAVPLEPRPLARERLLPRRHARGAVWVFTQEGSAQPKAVFSRKHFADEWLRDVKLSGTLAALPLDAPTGDAANVSPSCERYFYVEGEPTS